MSYQASAWAQRQATGGMGPKCLLLTLANHADPAGVGYPGRKTLASECECRPETVTAHLAKLERAGLIARFQRRRANGSRTSDWIVLAPQSSDRGEMLDASVDEYPAAIAALGQKSSGENFSGEDSTPGQVRNSGGPEEVREEVSSSVEKGARLRINGKAVKDETWRKTTRALEEFNRQAARSVLAVTGTGEPSEAAKRVYGRLAAWPNLSSDDIADVIRRTLASRWWGSDPPTIGVVFGPKVFEENLSRAETSANGAARGAAGRSATVGRASKPPRPSYNDTVIWTQDPDEAEE